PVLDRDVERMPSRVEIVHDRLEAPVAVAVDDVAGIAALEQLGIVARVVGPGRPAAGPRPDSDRRAIRLVHVPESTYFCALGARMRAKVRTFADRVDGRRGCGYLIQQIS